MTLQNLINENRNFYFLKDNFQNLITCLHFERAHCVCVIIDENRTTPRYIIVKFGTWEPGKLSTDFLRQRKVLDSKKLSDF